MGKSPRDDTWSVRKSAVPRPRDQHADSYFGFVPSQARQPASGDDPLCRSIVRLLSFRVGEGTPRKAGTGVVIGPDILITAAHNVYDPTNSGFGTQRQGYAQGLQVTSEHMPIPAPTTTRFVAPPGYTAKGDRGADIAVVKLNAPMPNATALAMQALADQQLQQRQIIVYGYPELAPQLFLGRGICVAARPTVLFHTADAAEGESGGALLIVTRAARCWPVCTAPAPRKPPATYRPRAGRSGSSPAR